MCGIVGCAGDITGKTKDVFRTLLVLDTLRGPHSTGVATINKAGWEVVKKKGNPWDLFDSREYTSAMAATSYCLIGHNRYATKGKINNINAHPFEFENVVGCHNGTIRGQHRLIDYQQFEVDSENIFHSIEHEGIDDTLDVLEGAYALTYWDKREDNLVLLRNSERPLFYTFTEDMKTMFWASEEWMIRIATSRCGVKHGEVIEVRPCNIYRFKIDMRFQPDPIQVSIQAFKEFKAPLPVVKHNSGGYNGSGAWPKKGEPVKKPEEGKPAFPVHELRKMQGAVAEFEVDGHKQNGHRQWFVSGHLKEHPEVEVRVFAHVGGELWNNLVLNYDSVFEGEITSFAQSGDMCYVNMKLDSVQEIIEFDDEDETDEENDFSTYLGHNNKLLTEEQFTHATANGCAWCSSQVSVLDAKYLEWVADDSFICADCQEVDEVKEYLQAV